MINVFDAIDVHRLFQFRAPTESATFLPFVVFFAALVFIALIIRLLLLSKMHYKYQKDFVASIVIDLAGFGLFGLAFTLARRTGIALFGSRIFLVAVLFLVIWKTLYFLYYRVTAFPSFERLLNQEQKRLKYMPRKKKK